MRGLSSENQSQARPSLDSSSEHWLKLGYLRFEKCELQEAQECFSKALEIAKSEQDPSNVGEALAGLLRIAGEALDEKTVARLNEEIDVFLAEHPDPSAPKIHYCRGVIEMFRENWIRAQSHFHHYLKLLRDSDTEDETSVGRALCMMANCLQQRGHLQRALSLSQMILDRYEKKKHRGLNGITYLVIGNIFERKKHYNDAMEWFKQAHSAFLEEHNWYFHLYVLYGYARLARLRQNYRQSNFYIELIEAAASAPEFGVLRREMALERARLEKDVFDILIDGRRGLVRTRDGREISFRKQFVLLEILKALSRAHQDGMSDVSPSDQMTGLSKAQLIQRVWQERYRPDAHDNKLYYNINRLRKLIEPDQKKPQYVLNWREGYRLAPGLRIQFVDLDSTRSA